MAERTIRARERRLKIESARSRHPHVAHDASDAMFGRMREKIVGGSKCLDAVSGAAQLSFECTAHRWIVIDDEHGGMRCYAGRLSARRGNCMASSGRWASRAPCWSAIRSPQA